MSKITFLILVPWWNKFCGTSSACIITAYYDQAPLDEYGE